MGERDGWKREGYMDRKTALGTAGATSKGPGPGTAGATSEGADLGAVGATSKGPGPETAGTTAEGPDLELTGDTSGNSYRESRENTGAGIGSPEPASAYKPRKKPDKFPASKPDKWMAVWMFFVAYLGVEWFWIGTDHVYYGAGVFAYTLIYGLSVSVYAKMTGHKVKAEGVFWFAVMVLCGFSYAWVYNGSLMGVLAIFLRLVSLYYTAVVFEVLVDGRTSGYFAVDGFLHFIHVPFHNLTAQLKIAGRRMKVAKEVLCVLAGCMAAVPLLVVVMCLLSDADSNFGNLLWSGFDFLFSRWGHILWTAAVSLPVGAYLYGQMYGCSRKRGTDAVTAGQVREELNKWAVVPLIGMCPAMIGVVALYVLFIGLQGGYYLDALRGVLPEAFTYSEYARQGFFELVAVSLINLGIICLVRLFCRRKPKASLLLRCHTVILSVLTLFLIATAMTKMYLYIQAYGLTPLRVIPSIFMVFLTVVFILTALSQFIRIPAARISVYVFAAGFTVLALSGMDGRIAEYNLGRYATAESIPRRVLLDGSLASVPAMYRVWAGTGDEELKEQLSEIAGTIRERNGACYSPVGFSGMNREKQEALNALQEMCPVPGDDAV